MLNTMPSLMRCCSSTLAHLLPKIAMLNLSVQVALLYFTLLHVPYHTPVRVAWLYSILPYSPWKMTCSTSSSFTPAACRTSTSFTPVQVALLIALVPQESPLTDLTAAISLRLFPAHSRVADIVTILNLKILFRSGAVNLIGCFKPRTS